MKKLYFFLAFFAITIHSNAQTQIWSDTFEDTGAPSTGSRTPSLNFSCGSPATSYFFRTDNSGITLGTGSYTNFQGSKFWAGEDLDSGPTCTNASISANQFVTWSGINIAGKTALSFKGLFAANGSFGSNWEGSSFGANQDYIVVEYRIDGGSWNKAVAFYAGTTGQTQTLKLETTGDLVGDGADLTYSFAEFSANLSGTGSLLDLRLNVFANGSATEEIAVDNFRLFGTNATTLPVDIVNFAAKAIADGVQVSWKTEAERNSLNFELLHSGNGVDFRPIAKIDALGQSETGKLYSYVHEQPSNGTNYYQLMQRDIDGTTKDYGVKSVSFGTLKADEVSLFPNPSGNNFTIKFEPKTYTKVEVVDLLGRKVFEGKIVSSETEQTINLSKLPSGTYTVVLSAGNDKVIRKIVKI